jgi:hypothetical protein
MAMTPIRPLPAIRRLLPVVFAAAAVACGAETASNESDITDVPQSAVEEQSIGNCWLYATASWVESMHLAATGQGLDASQSYWTYWHWYDQIVEENPKEIETGGSEWESFDILRERGLMREADFIKEDAVGEMSARQESALAKMNSELKTGRLSTAKARTNGKLVRQVLDEAWGLPTSVRSQLDKVFGTTGGRTFLTSATASGTKVLRARDVPVRYTERVTSKSTPTVVETGLDVAVDEWTSVYYPTNPTSRRNFQIRVQKALHDKQPVIVSWSVDFNAMADGPGELQGSFSLETLRKAGKPGSQGGHMTVLEDYEVTTKEFGVLEAGVTLDPANASDAKKLAAALLPSSTVSFWRIKNSWGALHDERSSAPGFPGYHDLYQTYLDGPITWCPDVEGAKTATNCKATVVPLEGVVLPPGY